MGVIEWDDISGLCVFHLTYPDIKSVCIFASQTDE